MTTTSLHLSASMDSLMLMDLIRTASGKGGGRDTETEVTTRARHEGLLKPRRFSYAVIDEDKDNSC